jgi:hypothetical protein
MVSIWLARIGWSVATPRLGGRDGAFPPAPPEPATNSAPLRDDVPGGDEAGGHTA